MASNDSSKAISAAILVKNPAFCHSYDDWLLPAARSNPDAVFASKVIDLARGARVIASIVSAHVVDLNAIAAGAGSSVRPLLPEADLEALARLAVTSLDHLYKLSHDQVDALNAKAEAGSKV